MIKYSLAEFLENQGIGTRMAETGGIFVGELPLDKNNVVAVLNSPSNQPDKALDLYDQAIDFWGRFGKSDEGFTKMSALYDLLHKRQEYQITGFHVYFSHALDRVNDLGRDVQRRKLYKLPVRFIYRNLEEAS